MNSCLWPPPPPPSRFVRLMYHCSAQTGHQSLSAVTEETDLMSGMNISGGQKVPKFLLRIPDSGSAVQQLIPIECALARSWECAILYGVWWNTTLIDSCISEAWANGLKGASDSADRTWNRSQDGMSLRTGGCCKNIPRMSWAIAGLFDIDNPSGNPLWIAAIAEWFIVVITRLLLNRWTT